MSQLSDIVGQDAAVLTLRRALKANRLAQAFLFSGPEGVGKATTARALASALNCLERQGEGCTRCSSCARIDQEQHPDVIQISPDGVAIKIDQVRELEGHLGYAPHEGRYRVVIIDHADHLNLHAANALLKSVEEPRPSTIFVLTAAAKHRVVPTLISRCQQIRFVPLPSSQVLTILGRLVEHDPAELQTAASLAEGSVSKALRLLEGDRMESAQALLEALLSGAQSSTVLELFQSSTSAGKDRNQLAEVLDLLRVWLRDLLLVAEGLDHGRLINVDKLPIFQSEAARSHHSSIIRRLRAVDEAGGALRGNVNPSLVMENLVLCMRQATTP